MSQTESQNFLGLSFDGTFIAKNTNKAYHPKAQKCNNFL